MVTAVRASPEDPHPIVSRLLRLDRVIAETARQSGVSRRLLRDRVALHLPLLYPHEWGDESAEHALVHRMAALLPLSLMPPTTALRSPRELAFGLSGDAELRVYAAHHYLQSYRSDSIGFALRWDGRPVALATVAPVDQHTIRRMLVDAGSEPAAARMIARVWTADWCPANTVSYLLARVAAQMAHVSVRSLVTYVNPNLGYHGASYRASGWSALGSEPTLPYAYVDGEYVTMRRLAAATGTFDRAEQKLSLGSRLRFSTLELTRLLVFYRELV
jgi:hypothetical protein